MHKAFSLAALLVTAVAPPAEAATRTPAEASTSGTSFFDFLIREPGVRFDGGIPYGPDARHRLDVFAPDRLSSGPIVLFLYGGAWTSGDRSTYEFVGTALAARGITTVIADYRLYPQVRFPTFVEDAARAYGWVDRHLARTDGGLRPIYLMGHSAGAHIAALLTVDRRWLAAAAPRAAAPRAVAPAGLVGLAGPYAFDPTTWDTTAAIFASVAGRADRARPAHLVRRKGPPTLLLHGADDRTVGLFNTKEFAEALTARGTSVHTVVYPDIGHVGLVSALAKPLRWRADVLDDVVAFVERGGERESRAPRAEMPPDRPKIRTAGDP
ncbi:alpha/beta hydrolase [Pinisolibacter aquiterrae]|uniref:alpha/beta hydrolase n=1 Tax=Pinisolibacter aquiterrae TaxID=2815579 RepID=UPI001C3E61A9|nr:alpha/beta hydrolase [Pinisolibacter aquiterrae]MBV5263856.1 alpha/beta hydrolase [Pinisolibacter aquiterrae]MCC8237249.1 alpha/beta hydrolase [Pinisolibacter aquiterrae]